MGMWMGMMRRERAAERQRHGQRKRKDRKARKKRAYGNKGYT
jgi:hypothetical protein